jgi:hypothetical protein
MSFSVINVNLYTYSVTFVTGKILHSLKEIIRESGLSPEKLTDDWPDLQRGIKTWLETRDLEQLILEVYDPRNNVLIKRWDFDIDYSLSGDGTMWVDTDDIRYHIRKAGLWPSTCEYCIKAITKPGRPKVDGWSNCTLRSTNGLVRYSIGTTINGDGLGSRTAYWS